MNPRDILALVLGWTRNRNLAVNCFWPIPFKPSVATSRFLQSELSTHKGVTVAKPGETTAMPRSMEDAAVWRAKADEARAHAAKTTDPQIRSAMLKIAQSYEHLAAIVERTAADATLSLYI